MKPREFLTAYLPFAKETERKTGINALVILAQSALETGWGEFCPGNMMFGVKDWDGLNGNEQLVPTFEFNKNPNLTAKQIGLASIDSIVLDAKQSKANGGVPTYKYSGKAYFRKYTSPEESFTDHAQVLKQKQFAKALKVKDDVELFVRAMAPVYAQSPSYADTVLSIVKSLQKEVSTL